MVYDKKDLDMLDIFYWACYVSLIYKFIYIYKKMAGVVVLFLLSVLRQTEVVLNVVLFFFKMPEPRNIKIVIFREHFSHSLKNMA